MNKITSLISRYTIGSCVNAKLIKSVSGTENIPAGNFIMAGNHASHVDYLIDCYLCTPRKFTIIGQVDKMKGCMKFLRDLAYGYAGVIPVNRNEYESRKQAIAKAVDMLKDGYCLIMYPEGTRTRDGKLHEFKPGVGRFCVESGAPVLPVAHLGTYEMMPPGAKAKISRTARIVIGKPMDFSKERQAAREFGKDSDGYRRVCADIAKKIEAEVAKLLEESYK